MNLLAQHRVNTVRHKGLWAYTICGNIYRKVGGKYPIKRNMIGKYLKM